MGRESLVLEVPVDTVRDVGGGGERRRRLGVEVVDGDRCHPGKQRWAAATALLDVPVILDELKERPISRVDCVDAATPDCAVRKLLVAWERAELVTEHVQARECRLVGIPELPVGRLCCFT